jgi:5-methylcytosine-specific restriction endonuclease McrA
MTSVRRNPVAWESFYKTARWRRLREFQLAQHPLCKFCLERGIVTAANVVDHVTPQPGRLDRVRHWRVSEGKSVFESFGLTDVTP